MGHYIAGYSGDLEIAYLYRGSFDELNGTIYNALNCNKYNHSCSGNREQAKFSEQQLLTALNWLSNKEEFEPERRFLKDCLANLDENNEVLIYFG